MQPRSGAANAGSRHVTQLNIRSGSCTCAVAATAVALMESWRWLVEYHKQSSKDPVMLCCRHCGDATHHNWWSLRL